MNAYDDRKRALQPTEGQVLSFRDEEIRKKKKKMAS
jgi:hypothetical protein